MIDLNELERLYAAATSGVWETRPKEGDGIYVEGQRQYDAVLGDSPCGCGANLDPSIEAEDAQAIVALHNAFPELLERLRSAEEDLDQMKSGMRVIVAEREALKTENARLRKALAEIRDIAEIEAVS